MDESTRRRAFLTGVADEFLQVWRRGRRMIAVTGASRARAARFADDLEGALRERGVPVARESVDDVGGRDLRRGLVAPFRAGERPGAGAPDTVLVVDGDGLLDEEVRDVWHYSVWTLAGNELPHAAATEIVDVTDESAPKHHVYDYCALPPSVGQRSVPAPPGLA